MSFASKLYTDIIMQSILYKLIKFFIYILFLDLSSQMSLLNSLCYVIIFFHRKCITVNDVAYANACAFTHSERSL